MATIKSTLELALPDIFYEDPEPVEDHMQQEDTIIHLAHLLKSWFQPRGNTFVSGGGFIFYNEANGNDRVAPDCFIALDRDPDYVYQFENYFLWEVGKPPDFVLEVASRSTAQNDLGRKRDLYARLGIPEYWRMDPRGGRFYGAPLTGEQLVNGEYVPFPVEEFPDGSVQSHSEVLDLDFFWDREREKFDIIDPATGMTIDREDIERRAREAERQAREEAESQADMERRARLEAEFQAETERRARLESESQVEVERRARREAEERIRALTEENERLRMEG